MIYWGGPTFGYNGLPDYTDPTNPAYDPNVNVLLYFQDFYGHKTYNLPAAYTYKRAGTSYPTILMQSIHSEADQTACSTGCLPTGYISADSIARNRAWLAHQVNAVAGTNWAIPTVPVAPSLSTAKPHTGYPTLACYSTGAVFCDTFKIATGTTYEGMFQWQRNQTDYNHARPWNVTFIPNLMSQNYGYGVDGAGDGFAIVVPDTATGYPPATIRSKAFSTIGATGAFSVQYKGKTLSGGNFLIEYTTNGGSTWTTIRSGNMYPSTPNWTTATATLPQAASVMLRFSCWSGAATTNHCAIDNVFVM